MSDDNIEPPELPRSSMFIVDPMNSSIRKIMAGFYSLSIQKTKFFNAIQIRLKQLLFTWIGGTLLAFVYVLSGNEATLPIGDNLLMSLIALISSRVVLRLLYLETQIYHKNLNAAFITGFKMEEKGLVTPKIHINMMQSLLPEADKELYNNYKGLINPKFLKFKKFLISLLTFKIDKKPIGLDPLFYDVLIYASFCLILWFTASFFFCVFLNEEGVHHLASLGKWFFPLTSILSCIFVVKRALKAGYDNMRQIEAEE